MAKKITLHNEIMHPTHSPLITDENRVYTTRLFDRIVSYHTFRTVILQGGTGSSKTYSILQYLIFIATKSPIPLIISIVGETLPALKRGPYRDFMKILGSSYDQAAHNKTDLSYKIGHCTIEFFSADQPSKVRGPRRDILYINECNNVDYETYTQLEIRTRRRVFLDFNPTSEFWVHEEILTRPVGVAGDKFTYKFDISTYKDNQYLDASVVRAIEMRRYDLAGNETDWYKVYGKGEIGSKEGLVYPEFEQIDIMPDLPSVYGLDFGFSNDVAALVKVCITGSSLYLHELMYDLNMTNDDISELMDQSLMRKHLDITYADCAEPKSIVELCRRGWIVKPSLKGRDSVIAGIDWIKQKKIYVTKSSTNLIKELRNYKWAKDRDGKPTNQPIDSWNHCMDAIRYACRSKMGTSQSVKLMRMRF
jgi:phage terminase large subunit